MLLRQHISPSNSALKLFNVACIYYSHYSTGSDWFILRDCHICWSPLKRHTTCPQTLICIPYMCKEIDFY